VVVEDELYYFKTYELALEFGLKKSLELI